MTAIIPAILVPTLPELENALTRVDGLAPHIQLDIMDGVFVPQTSFLEREELTSLPGSSKLELHLMVQHPLSELSRWQHVARVFRVIFHAEALDNIGATIGAIKTQGWQVGIALNPTTDLSAIAEFLPKIDLVLCMTVPPGAQGQKAILSVGNKVKELAMQSSHPLIAIDGGVNMDTLPTIRTWGADILNVGSAILSATDPRAAYEELKSLL